MVDISDMLFIVRHVGHNWRSWETKIFETITKSKVFETNTTTFSRTNFFRPLLRLFLRPKFSRPIPRLFLRPKFLRPIPRLFFETKYFRDRYRDFFSRLNIFETETDTLKKLRKVSIPRSLDTRCHTPNPQEQCEPQFWSLLWESQIQFYNETSDLWRCTSWWPRCLVFQTQTSQIYVILYHINQELPSMVAVYIGDNSLKSLFQDKPGSIDWH